MNVSPITRYYVRRLLAEHPVVQSQLRDHSQPWSGSPEDYLEHYIKLDYLTYPQLNELEFLIELHQKIKVNEPHRTQQLKNIERKIFKLVSVDLPISADAVADLVSFFSQLEDTETLSPTMAPSAKVATLRQYSLYFQLVTDVTARYLGRMIVNNYWLLSRPRDGWLSQINVEQVSATVDLSRFLPTARLDLPLSRVEVESLDQWIHGFIRHACRVLPTLPRLLLAAGIPGELLYDLVRDTA